MGLLQDKLDTAWPKFAHIHIWLGSSLAYAVRIKTEQLQYI